MIRITPGQRWVNRGSSGQARWQMVPALRGLDLFSQPGLWTEGGSWSILRARPTQETRGGGQTPPPPLPSPSGGLVRSQPWQRGECHGTDARARRRGRGGKQGWEQSGVSRTQCLLPQSRWPSGAGISDSPGDWKRGGNENRLQLPPAWGLENRSPGWGLVRKETGTENRKRSSQVG